MVILGFIPSDQRKFSYNFIFPLSLTIIKIAEKYGGRPYPRGFTSPVRPAGYLVKSGWSA